MNVETERLHHQLGHLLNAALSVDVWPPFAGDAGLYVFWSPQDFHDVFVKVQGVRIFFLEAICTPPLLALISISAR